MMSNSSKILIIIIILLLTITVTCGVLYFMEKDKKKVSFNTENNSIEPDQQNVDDENEVENDNLQLIELNFDNMPKLGIISPENYKTPNCGKNWNNLDPNSGLNSDEQDLGDCESQSYPQSLDNRRE